jgi:D-amino-acid dehydrogenase
MEILGPLGHLSRRLFDELLDEESLDCQFVAEGYYDIFRTQKGFEGARPEISLQQRFGYDTRAILGPALEEMEQALQPGTVGGLFFPESAIVDPRRFLGELARAAKSHGAEIRVGTKVTDLIAPEGRLGGVGLEDGDVVEGDVVILATGVYSLDLPRAAGLELPIQPAKGYHRDLPTGEGGTRQLRLTMMLGERYVFCTPMGDFLRLAGTLEFSGLNHTIVPDRMENLTRSASRYLAGVEGGRSVDDWVGLRPVTHDGLPILGPAPGLDGLFIANGHAMLGLTLGPITGKILADWIVEGAPPKVSAFPGDPRVDLAALRPDRF